MAEANSIGWLAALKSIAEKNRLVLLRFGDEEWEWLSQHHRGRTPFTIARLHSLFKGARIPAPCLIRGDDDRGPSLYFGIITSRRHVTTLESRAKVEHVSQIEPESEAQLFSLVPPGIHRHSLRKQLSSAASVVVLSPGLSGNLIEGLASIESNHEALRAAAWSFTSPRTYGGNLALQMDAVRVALKTFGLSLDAPAVELGLVDARETSLARAEIVEDGVIEHDCKRQPKSVPLRAS